MKPIQSFLARCRDHLKSERVDRLLYALTGLMALLWLLIRVIPKPQRAAYPCQRAAFPIASSFVLWIISLLSFRQFFRKSRGLALESRWGPAVILGTMGRAFHRKKARRQRGRPFGLYRFPDFGGVWIFEWQICDHALERAGPTKGVFRGDGEGGTDRQGRALLELDRRAGTGSETYDAYLQLVSSDE